LGNRSKRAEARVEGVEAASVSGMLKSASAESISREAWKRRLDTPYCRFMKPVIDRFFGAALAILTLPVAAIAGLVIRTTTSQPAIYRQDRVGRDGTVFTVYKLQTMVPDRRTEVVAFDGQERRISHKTRTDPRVTRIGRFLRKWSLDEFPQFWNVAKGEMSLVGPRPELVGVVADYETWQHHRHLVRPGITGIWQVSERGDTPMHEATALDLMYLERISLRTDLAILLRTVPAAFGMRAGY
jgi:lipopolysaccharide/colanic/teichoic acid biosynthesis glycosyltransferase